MANKEKYILHILFAAYRMYWSLNANYVESAF